MNATSSKGMKVREGRTFIDIPVPYQGIISFISPAFGRGDYFQVRNEVQEADLLEPTSAQTVALAYESWQDPEEFQRELIEKYQKIIRGIVKNDWLWAFTGHRWIPKAVYLQDRPSVKEGRVAMNESELDRILEAGSFEEGGATFSKDRSVRFVPLGFKTGEHAKGTLSKNPYCVAYAGGLEGAEQLDEIASHYSENPHVSAFDNVNEPFTTISALYSDYDGGLHLGGGDVGYGGGHAFGVSKSGEARAKK